LNDRTITGKFHRVSNELYVIECTDGHGKLFYVIKEIVTPDSKHIEWPVIYGSPESAIADAQAVSAKKG